MRLSFIFIFFTAEALQSAMEWSPLPFGTLVTQRCRSHQTLSGMHLHSRSAPCSDRFGVWSTLSASRKRSAASWTGSHIKKHEKSGKSSK